MKIFSEELVEKAVKELHIANLAQATIGDVLLVAQYLEKETGIPFIRMDQGSPGLAANQIGIEAEKAALDRGVGSQYPAAAGVPELKKEASRFVKAFLNLDTSPRACVPTTGSVAGSFGSFIACTDNMSAHRFRSSCWRSRNHWLPFRYNNPDRSQGSQLLYSNAAGNHPSFYQ